jgi:hypothetical protein
MDKKFFFLGADGYPKHTLDEARQYAEQELRKQLDQDILDAITNEPRRIFTTASRVCSTAAPLTFEKLLAVVDEFRSRFPRYRFIVSLKIDPEETRHETRIEHGWLVHLMVMGTAVERRLIESLPHVPPHPMNSISALSGIPIEHDPDDWEPAP